MSWIETAHYAICFDTKHTSKSIPQYVQLNCAYLIIFSAQILMRVFPRRKNISVENIYISFYFFHHSLFTFLVLRKTCKKELLRPKKTFSLAVTFNYFNLFFFEIRNIIYALNGLMWRQQIHWKKTSETFLFCVHLQFLYLQFT